MFLKDLGRFPEGSGEVGSSDLKMGSTLRQKDSLCQFRRQDIFVMGSLLQQNLHLSIEELFRKFRGAAENVCTELL